MTLALLLVAALDARAAERLLTGPTYDAMLGATLGYISVASDGSSFLAAWVAQPRLDRSAMLMVQRLDAAPTAMPIAIALARNPAPFQNRVDLAWSHGSYFVVWNLDRELHAMRVDRDGHPIAGTHQVLSADLHNARVAANDTTTIVIGTSFSLTSGALTLDANDQIVKQTPVGGTSIVARDGGFTAAENAGGSIYAVRFDAAGNLLDTTPLLIMREDAYRARSVAVASRGSDTLIVWSADVLTGTGQAGFSVLLPSSGGAGPRNAVPLYTNVTDLDLAADADGYSLLIDGFPSESAGVSNDLEYEELRADGTFAAWHP